MCLAIPGRLMDIEDVDGVRMGKVIFGGIIKKVCLQYTSDAAIGDYVMVHVGFAISKVDQKEAERTYKLLEDLRQLSDLEAPDIDDLKE